MNGFKYALGLIFLLHYTVLPAQQDTTGILTPAQFSEYLLQNHPVVKKADIIEKSGTYEVKRARGNFDPKLFSNWNAKNFKSTSYYKVSESGVKIPTWYGLDLKLYYEANSGTYLNPESNVPSNGLYGVGLTLPLGEGLFTDERRTALNKAKVINDINSNKKQDILRNLLYDGFATYWNWVKIYNKQQVIAETSERAKERFRNVRASYMGGEKSAIDTTDALSQWQKWQIKLTDIRARYQKYAFKVSNYLWDDQQNPLEITNQVSPPEVLSLPLPVFKNLRDQAQAVTDIPENHPSLVQYRNKLDILEIENKWKKEQLKPTLDLKYHALQDAGSQISGLEDKVRKNMKWGIAFEFPVFLRKEMNSLRLNEMKMQNTRLDLLYKRQTLQNKLNGLQVTLDNLYSQIKQNRDNLDNYRRLIDAEETRLENGESTIFQVNYREMAYLKQRMEQVKYIARFFKHYSAIMYLYNMEQEIPQLQD